METKETIGGGATLWARQTIESEIFCDKPDKWFKIWFYLINRVSHKDNKKYKRGETFLHYDWIREATGATTDQIKKCVGWLKNKGMVSTSRSTRGVNLIINNYNHFQTLDNYYCNVKAPDEALEKHQRSTREAPRYNKNDKNDKKLNNKVSTNNLRAEPAGSDSAEEVLTAEDLESKQLSNGVNEILDMFYKTINPNISFGNTTTRKACEFLIKKYGLQPTKGAIEYAISVQGKPYAPTITTPYQLKEKMSALVIYKQKEESGLTKNNKGKDILGL